MVVSHAAQMFLMFQKHARASHVRVGMKMETRLILFLTIVMKIPESLAEDGYMMRRCCDEVNLTVSGCQITEIVASGQDQLLVRRSDGISFKVEMSMLNLVPRHYYKFGTRTDIDFNCRDCDLTRVAITLDSEDLIFVRSKNASGHFILLESRNTRWEKGWPDFRPECDSTVPLVLRRLFNCKNETHDENYFLHHVGTFYSRDRKNSTLVGYYRRRGDAESGGWTTRVIAWDEHGGELKEKKYLDHSRTISLTGWREKDGKELIISVNAFGHMCFFYRSYDSLNFLPPGKGDKLMPECLQGHMLYGCPQDFCHTGFVDEIVESERQSGLVVALVRGIWWHECQRFRSIESDRLFWLDHCNRTKMQSSSKYFEARTVVAAFVFGER